MVCRDLGSQSFSGLARSTADLAAGLATRGHRISVISGRCIEGEPLAIDGVAIVPAVPTADVDPESALGQLLHAAAAHREIVRLARDDQPVDAVIAPLWRSEGAICLLDERFPTVVSCMTSLTTLTELDPAWRALPDIGERLALERAAMRSARYLHGLTVAALEKTVADHQLNPDAWTVIGRGLSDRTAGVAEPAGARAAGAGDPTLNVLFVGRLEHRKGVDVLLAAARQLIQTGVPLTFTVVGPDADPNIRAQFERDSAEMPAVRLSVQFTGAVSERQLDELYRRADIVCAPSRYESHGVVLLEAMMYGKPIVACDAGGVGEVLTAGRDAILCPPDDPDELAAALNALTADPLRRAKLKLAARQTFERRFSADAAAKEMETFLDRVVASHALRTGPTPTSVSARLEALLRDVFPYSTPASRELCRELLADPPPTFPAPAEAVRRRVRGAALGSPPQQPAGPRSTDIARVTAVILSHDLPVLALDALRSVTHSGLPVQTLMLDNGSPPTAAAILLEGCAARERTELRRVENDLGCAGGRSYAVEMVETDYVLFLDDDAELMPFALAHLVHELDTYSQAAAVTATVVNADGLVYHSGGWLHVTEQAAEFSLCAAGVPFESVELSPTGHAGWTPGTAMLVRRAVLEEFPIDTEMSSYYEDNEWCYRVELTRPGSFRRSSEALVFHRPRPKPATGAGSTLTGALDLLAAPAHFYQRHRVLLSPAVFEIVDELQVPGGVRDFAGARLLMELFLAMGPDWMLTAWTDGDLDGLLGAARRAHDLMAALKALDEVTQELAASQSALRQAEADLRDTHARVARDVGFLQYRHELLTRIEHGGWWRLRGHLLPLLRLFGRLQRLASTSR